MRRAIVCVAVLLFGGAACGGEPEPEPFSFVGQVLLVREGDEPEDVPVQDGGGNAGTQGALGIRPLEDEDPIDCRADVGAYLVYFNEGTEFVPASITKPRNFPQLLRGQLVGVEGVFYKEGRECTFIAQRAGTPESIGDTERETDATPTPRAKSTSSPKDEKDDGAEEEENEPATSTATDTRRNRN